MSAFLLADDGYRDNACEPQFGRHRNQFASYNLTRGGNWAARWTIQDYEIGQTLRFAEPRVVPFHHREPMDGRAFFDERHRRIAAIAWVSNLRLRFSGFEACFAFDPGRLRNRAGRSFPRLSGAHLCC
jgi:hypothetical protein